MNIKIVDSWLREYIDTKATSSELAKTLSLTSVSVEKTEKIENEIVYDIEVTTNRPDLMSVVSLAREAGAVLPEHSVPARFSEPKTSPLRKSDEKFPLEIQNDPKLVNRICAVVMEVEIDKSPQKIAKRLELSGIRSLNNLIDVTNYVMREIGHPCHVFDFDLLTSGKMIIRESKPGEEIVTLDGKKYRLFGGDIVADDGKGQIIDLLGVMGTQNSVVQDSTKKILFFIDNNNPVKIRSTSMSLGIRTEAAVLNEKGVDPELAMVALARGIELYQEIANGKVVSQVLDIYPNKPKSHHIEVSLEKINQVIGVEIEPEKSIEILNRLGFDAKKISENISIEIPTLRSDVRIEEDVIEEVARVYGYEKLPSIVPTFLSEKVIPYSNDFFFEKRIKNALKYWGFDEVYSYSLVSEDLYDGPVEGAIKLKNPLSEDMSYLRNTLVPSLLEVAQNNKSREEIRVFELSNVYHKKIKDLPEEKLMLGGLLKKRNVSFYEIKGLIETLLLDNGIENVTFKNRSEGAGADIKLGSEHLGYIEILNSNLADFELDFNLILRHATLKKIYKTIAKFPPIVEDITLVLESSIQTSEVIEKIKQQNSLISEVNLLDTFESARTFRIIYQAQDRNLTTSEIKSIRDQIIKILEEDFKATVK